MQKLAPDREVCDRYVLLERIGSGGHGEIWRARDRREQREVALKILHPALARSPEAWVVLQREHLMTLQLDHPSILGTSAPVRDRELMLLPMEYAGGGDARRLRAQSYIRIVPVLIEVAEALAHAHSRGVVHRDLKPGNVLFDSRGKVRLADFGAADFAGSSDALTTGSPFSASPQQLRDEPTSPADDIYGLGALAYELLSGYPPYYPDFELERRLSEPPAPLVPAHPAPPRLVALVESMLADEPAERPASMAPVIERLYHALSDTLELDDELSRRREPPAFKLTQPQRREAEALTEILLPPLDPFVFAPRTGPASLTAPTQEIPVDETLVMPLLPGFQGVAAARTGVLQFDEDGAPEHPPEPPLQPPLESPPEPPPRPAFEPPAAPLRIVEPRIEARTLPPPPPPPRRRRRSRAARVWLGFAAVALLALAAIVLLPQLAERRAASGSAQVAAPAADVPGTGRPAAATEPPAPPATEDSAGKARDDYVAALQGLEARQAGAWGGAAFAAARAQGEQAQRELDAGDFAAAQDRYAAATRLLAPISSGRDAALQRELAAAASALAAGQSVAARQAFERAALIDAESAAVRQGRQDVAALEVAVQRVAAGAAAESAGRLPDALAAYEQAVQRSPQFTAAREARDRVRTEIAEAAYARAVARGFEALRGGRYAAARAAFEEALPLRADNEAARGGLSQVQAAFAAEDFDALRHQAAGLEAGERWADALKEYERVLAMDPTLRFARQGRDRAEQRVSLSQQLDRFIAEPERLAAPEVQTEAKRVLTRAVSIDQPGPVLRSQMARVQILMEDFDRPVTLALQSDNTTHITIARVGALGAFTRRDLQLKPGRYTVIGTRSGFRDVRRDVLLAPGQRGAVVSVQCTERI